MPSGPRSAIRGIVVGIAVIVAAVPLAAATPADPLRVGLDSRDAVIAFSEDPGPDTVVIADADNDGRVDGDDPVYVSTDRDELPVGAVRIANPPSRGLGSHVRPGSPDQGASVDELRGEIRYRDADGDGEFGPHDTLFFDVSEGDQREIDGGDLVLSGPDAGSPAGQHRSIGASLEAVRARFAWADVHGDGSFGVDDPVAVDVGDAGDHFGPRDVALWSPRFGGLAGEGDRGIVYELEDSGAPTSFHYIDGDRDGGLDIDEPVFLSTDPGQVRGSSILIANTGDATPGRTAGETDASQGSDTERLQGDLRFADRDGTGELSLGDNLYLDRNDDRENEASIRDVAVAGPGAGAVVSGSYEHFGESLEDDGGRITYVDLDGNEGYAGGEPVFLDADDDGVLDDNEPPVGAAPEEPAVRPGVLRTLAAFRLDTVYAVDDADDDGVVDHGEATYAQTRGGDTVSDDSLRLAFPPGNQTIGSLAVEGDPDVGTSLVLLDGPLAYHDADGDGSFDLDENAYLDGDASGSVSPGDLLLGTRNATSVIGPRGDLVDRPLTDLVDRLSWSDADADGSLGPGDNVYADVNGDGLVTVTDLGFRSPEPHRSLDDLLTPRPPAEEPDRDGDGVGDGEDRCPESAGPEGNRGCPTTDRDGDGVPDSGDECPSEPGPQGDAGCPEDPGRDADGDGVVDTRDNCPGEPNPDQDDLDDDGLGDTCDSDVDGDGLTVVREEGVGTDPLDPDTDGDGVRDDRDDCPADENPDRAGDGTGGVCGARSSAGMDGVPGPGPPVALVCIGVALVLRRTRAAG